MCYKTTKSDVANSLSRLTGRSFENCLMDLNRIDKPRVFDSLGNFNVKGFGRIARSCIRGHCFTCTRQHLEQHSTRGLGDISSKFSVLS